MHICARVDLFGRNAYRLAAPGCSAAGRGGPSAGLSGAQQPLLLGADPPKAATRTSRSLGSGEGARSPGAGGRDDAPRGAPRGAAGGGQVYQLRAKFYRLCYVELWPRYSQEDRALVL